MDGCALPVKKLKGTDPVETLDLSGKYLGVASLVVIASLISVNGGLTSIDLSYNQLCDLDDGTYTAVGITAIADAMRVNVALTVTTLLGNQLDAKSAKLLAEVAKQKGISLCGIQHDQTTAHFRLKPPDAILLASDLTQAVVTGALTSINLRGNKLGDEGWGAIFAAICGNKDSKIMSLHASSGNIGPAGVQLIAEALRTSVTGALTVTNLLQNQLDEASAKMLAVVEYENVFSLLVIKCELKSGVFF